MTHDIISSIIDLYANDVLDDIDLTIINRRTFFARNMHNKTN